MKLQAQTRLAGFSELIKRYRGQLEAEAKKQKVNFEDLQVLVTIENPFKRRTTGAFSQNHCLNGIIQSICEETGQDFHSTKEYVKQMAIGRGYPIKTKKTVNGVEDVLDWWGNPVGISESESSVEQCAILIDCAIQLASELGIILKM